MIPFVLAWLLGPLVGLLGNDDFPTRERAQAWLAAVWPLSDPALERGRRGANPEVRHRADRAIRAGAIRRFGHSAGVALGVWERGDPSLLWLLAADPAAVRWDMVDAIRPGTREPDTVALKLVFLPYPETDGLPWLPHRHERPWAGGREVGRSLCRLTYAAFPGDYVLGCDERCGRPNERYLHGIQNVRFWVRGIPDGLFRHYETAAPYWQNVWAANRRRAVLPADPFYPRPASPPTAP